MRQHFFYCLLLVFLFACKKDRGSRVDIYLLKSFTATVDPATNPATTVISNAVLEDQPLVADQDILYYNKETTTFTLRKDIQNIIRQYGPDKGFAVTVDQQPVYYGRFHPLYLSSLTFGIATIAPGLSSNHELKIDFTTIEGNAFLKQLDKRNNSRIIQTLKKTGRLW